jgi:excisionase family DNA binding protein
MTERDDLVTTEEAARLLGVSVRRVQQMLETGDLSRVARGLVDRTSVELYLSSQHGGRTRVWSTPMAWGAIALLSGWSSTWLGPVQAFRLRTALHETHDARQLVARCRNRAEVHTYSGHRSVASSLAAAVLVVDQTRLGLMTANADGAIDGYLPTAIAEAAIARYALRESPSGSIVLRTTDFDLGTIGRLAEDSTVLAALDAATSLDPRVRGVGERALLHALEKFRDE